MSREVPVGPARLRSALRTLPPEPPADEAREVRWTDPSEVIGELPVGAHVEDAPAGCVLHLWAERPPRVPYFGIVFSPLLRAEARRHLRWLADRAEAEVLGRDDPGPRRPPAWGPPVPMSQAQVRTVATLCFVLAVAGFGGSLLTQTVDFFAASYGASDAQLGLVTAVTRAGTLVALAGGALADRLGRRRLTIVATATICAGSVLSAAAPALPVFTAVQVVVRGAQNLAIAVAVIAVVEEAPEGARAYLLAFAGLAGSVGFGAGAVLLPIADLAPEAWRILFVGAGASAAFLPGIAARLPETRRYEALERRGAPRGRAGEVAGRAYRGRFLLVAATGFLLNLFFAPSSQFTNRFLAAERGFSGLDVLALRAVTQVAPAIVAVLAGGKLAESRGRKPAARLGVLVMAVAGAAFFASAGPLLWVALTATTAAAGFAGPALAAFNTELFPTEVRGTAGGSLLIPSVAGSMVGLLLAGWLAEPLGSIGFGVAVTAAAPLVVGLFLVPHLPEARGMLLDDVSPPEV